MDPTLKHRFPKLPHWRQRNAVERFMRFHRRLLQRHRDLRAEVAELRQRNAQLEIHAVRDPLTGLYNRRSFVERMRARGATMAEDRRGVPPVGSPDALILLDIDHFKSVNDTYGHRAGDAILVDVAQRIQDVVRDSDMVLRWGGEEFLVFSPNTRIEQACRLTDRIMKAVGGQPVEIQGGHVAVTLSAGVAGLPFAGQPEARFNWERTVALADACLYLAKREGRNRSIGLLNPPWLDEDALQRVEADLGAAVAASLVDVVTTPGPAPAA